LHSTNGEFPRASVCGNLKSVELVRADTKLANWAITIT
jgi:hypothetical protein